MSKYSKSERKEDRIQSLEREITNLKKRNAELQQQKTVRLNEEQLERFLNEITKRMEWSTNKIIDETPRTTIVHSGNMKKDDGISFLMKCLISILFFAVAIAIIYSLNSIWGELWSAGLKNRIALVIVAIASFDCFALGIEILKERDRNYIVSIFSALVALVALIVALVK